MNQSCDLHFPFAELPSEARTLFSIYAVAALARFGAQLPEEVYLFPALEIVWNWNSLSMKDLADPTRLTDLMAEHFGLRPKGGSRSAQ